MINKNFYEIWKEENPFFIESHHYINNCKKKKKVLIL